MEGEIWKAVKRLDRHQIETLFQMVGIQCYESESTDQLRNDLLENVKDGTIPDYELYWVLGD